MSALTWIGMVFCISQSAKFIHRPVLVFDHRRRLGEVLSHMTVQPEHSTNEVIDRDLILVWGRPKRVLTGADILGRLLHGIARGEPTCASSLAMPKPGT